MSNDDIIFILGEMSCKEVIFCSEVVKIPVMSLVLSDCVCDVISESLKC